MIKPSVAKTSFLLVLVVVLVLGNCTVSRTTTRTRTKYRLLDLTFGEVCDQHPTDAFGLENEG